MSFNNFIYWFLFNNLRLGKLSWTASAFSPFPVPQESRQNTLYLYVILHCNTLKNKALSYNLINITKLN